MTIASKWKLCAVLPVLLVSGFTVLMSCQEEAFDQSGFPVLEGPYLGQKAPGMIPEMFGQVLAAPEHHKHSAPAFSADGTELFYSIYFNYERPQKILYTRQVNGVWTEPEVAWFSGVYQEGGPVFSGDGKRLYFYSKRPVAPDTVQVEDADIWYVERTDSGWSAPRNVGAPINTSDANQYPSFARSDRLMLFASQPGIRRTDIYAADIVGGGFSEPVNLGEPVSTPENIEGGNVLTADGQTLIFTRFYPDNPELRGLYMSTRKDDGSWDWPVRMGDMINRGGARFPGFSPDFKYFFFASYRSGQEELYWVDARIIDYLKEEDLSLVDRLTETFLNDGVEAASARFDEFRRQYSDYYLFDDMLFDAVGDRLLRWGEFDLATEAYRVNRSLFEQSFGQTRMLKLAVIENDSATVQEIVQGLNSESLLPENTVERDVNNLGYQLLGAGAMHSAVEILSVNVELFPESGNVYDSYAEALMHNGDTVAAIRNYQRSLELDSSNANASAMIERLRGEEGN